MMIAPMPLHCNKKKLYAQVARALLADYSGGCGIICYLAVEVLGHRIKHLLIPPTSNLPSQLKSPQHCLEEIPQA